MITRRIWTQAALFFLGLLFLLALAWLLISARPLLNALLVAVLLAYLLNPPVALAETRFGLSRKAAVLLVYSISIAATLAIVTFLGATVWGQVARLEQELHQALAEMQMWVEQPVVFLGFHFDLTPLVSSLEDPVGNAFARLPLGSGTIISSVTSNLMWSLVILIALYYFLKDAPRIRPGLVSLLPAQYQAEGDQLLIQIDAVWGVFLRMQLLIFAILSLLVSISSLLIVWLYRLGWLPLSPLGVILLLLTVYTAIQQLDNLWLRPRLMGKKLQLHPGVVMVALIAALALSGVLAAILIVPMLATLKILGDAVRGKLMPTSGQEPAASSQPPITDQSTQLE